MRVLLNVERELKLSTSLELPDDALENPATLASEVVLDDGQRTTARELINASGAGLVAGLLGLLRQSAQQWPAHRSLLRVPSLTRGNGARIAALRTAHLASGLSSAIALVALDGASDQWQLSLDVMPGSGLTLLG